MIKKDIIATSVEIKISGLKIPKDSVIIINDAGFVLYQFTKEEAIRKLEAK